MMRTILLVSLTLILAACGPQATVPLEWPSLQTLDTAVAELDGMLAENVAEDQLLAHLSEVSSALDAVVKAGVPAGAENPELVKEKLGELSSLKTEIQTASTAENKEALQALHPLVASIMETAGMAHVHGCENCPHCSGAKDHDHEGHDHAEHAHDEHKEQPHSHEGHDDHDH